jgi:hypothetical protein
MTLDAEVIRQNWPSILGYDLERLFGKSLGRRTRRARDHHQARRNNPEARRSRGA